MIQHLEKPFSAYNKEAEEALFGILFQDPELIRELRVKPDQVSPGRNHNLLWTMIDLSKKNIAVDPVSIAERVGPGKLQDLGGISYMAELAAGFFSVSKFEMYNDVIIEAHNKRLAAEVAGELVNGLPIGEAISKLSKIDETGKIESDGRISGPLKEMALDVMNATGGITGIPSGFKDMDKLTGGYKGGDLIIVAGRPSMGKTAYAINKSLNCVKAPDRIDGDISGIFSLEMSDKQLLKRAAAMVGNLDMQEMKTAGESFSPEDWNKFTHSVSYLDNCDLYIFDEGRTLDYIYRNVRRLRRDNPGRRIEIIIDYLQLIVGDEKYVGNRTQEIGGISRDLKAMAREFDVVVIALSQLSRGVEQRQDKRPMMSDIRESGQIEQDADIIQFLYRDEYYDKETEDRGITEVIIAKHRDGPTGTVKLAFVKEYGKFVSIDWGASA